MSGQHRFDGSPRRVQAYGDPIADRGKHGAARRMVPQAPGGGDGDLALLGEDTVRAVELGGDPAGNETGVSVWSERGGEELAPPERGKVHWLSISGPLQAYAIRDGK